MEPLESLGSFIYSLTVKANITPHPQIKHYIYQFKSYLCKQCSQLASFPITLQNIIVIWRTPTQFSVPLLDSMPLADQAFKQLIKMDLCFPNSLSVAYSGIIQSQIKYLCINATGWLQGNCIQPNNIFIMIILGRTFSTQVA